VSLSGVSYGVATGFIDSREIKNNEIRSRDIRNNEVRTRDLRNNEVRGIDIRNSTVQGRDIALNTVTGEDLNESTLGKVPSAAAADTATSAEGVATLKQIRLTEIAKGAPRVTLLTHGPLTVSAACTAATPGPGTRAQILLQTTENDSAGGDHPPEADIDVSDGATEIGWVEDIDVGTARQVDLQTVFGLAPSGKSFTGELGVVADENSTADSCMFHGHLALQG
jgi:hypothetical protein